jgi:hypothetical protein
MSSFYSLSDASEFSKKSPWGLTVLVSGPAKSCRACGQEIQPLAGRISVHLDESRGSEWTDLIGVGSFGPWVLISSRVLEGLTSIGQRYVDVHPVEFCDVPKIMLYASRPKYFLAVLNEGIRLDPNCGYVFKEHCSACGMAITDPVMDPYSVVDRFVDGSWNGMPVFLGDISGKTIYCDDRVVDLAGKHAWTNFRFIRCGKSLGDSLSNPGERYLNKK